MAREDLINRWEAEGQAANLSSEFSSSCLKMSNSSVELLLITLENVLKTDNPKFEEGEWLKVTEGEYNEYLKQDWPKPKFSVNDLITAKSKIKGRIVYNEAAWEKALSKILACWIAGKKQYSTTCHVSLDTHGKVIESMTNWAQCYYAWRLKEGVETKLLLEYIDTAQKGLIRAERSQEALAYMNFELSALMPRREGLIRRSQCMQYACAQKLNKLTKLNKTTA